MKYLYLNTLKSIIKKKTFFVGITLLLTLSTLLFTLLLNLSFNINSSFDKYKVSQNIQDVSFVPQAILTKQDIDKFYKTHTDVDPTKKAKIDAYYNIIDDKSISSAKLEANRENALGAMADYEDTLVYRYSNADELAKKYNFHYETEYKKDALYKINGVEHAFRFMPYNSSNKINVPYLVDGRFPQNNGEIAVYPEYLKDNNLTIGGNINILDKTYKIVGTYYAPNYIFPKIDLSSVFFDSNTQTLVLMKKDDFDALNIDMDGYLVGAFNNKPTDYNQVVRTISDDKECNYILDYMSDLSIGGGLFTMITAFNITSTAVLIAFVLISMLIVSFVVRQKVKSDSKQLGILKALGYNTYSVSSSYILFGVIAGLSAILGFFIAIIFKNPALSILRGYFALPLLDTSVKYVLLIIAFLVLFISISLISILIAYFMLKNTSINLINPKEKDEINSFTRFISNLTANSTFERRFKYTLASRSLPKLFSIMLLTTLCGMIITLIFIASNIFPALEANFSNYGYKYEVTYNNFLLQNDSKNGLQSGDTVMDSVKGTIDAVKGVPTENNKSSDGEFLNIMGIDSNNTSYPIYDQKGKIIQTTTDGVIVTSDFLTWFNAKVGDSVTITPQGKYDFRFDVKIVGVSSNFTDGPGVFLERSFLNNKLGNEEGSYNIRLTSNVTGIEIGTQAENAKVTSLVSMEETQNSYKQLSSIARYLIILLEIFMTFLAMILISLLSNLVIDDNAGQISLLKTMGYNRKEIDSIILNIYLPFVFLSIAIAIPLSYLVMDIIFGVIFGGSNIAFPVKLSFIQIIMGVALVLIGYYLSLKLNKKTLDKVPISIALKRE